MSCWFETLTALPMDISPIKGMCMQKFRKECLPSRQMTTSVIKYVNDYITHESSLRHFNSKWVVWSQGCLDITTSEFSVIKEASKLIALVPHMKLGRMLIFKISTQNSGSGPNVTGASSKLQGCHWSLAYGTKFLALMLCQMTNSLESSHLK